MLGGLLEQILQAFSTYDYTLLSQYCLDLLYGLSSPANWSLTLCSKPAVYCIVFPQICRFGALGIDAAFVYTIGT